MEGEEDLSEIFCHKLYERKCLAHMYFISLLHFYGLHVWPGQAGPST